MLQHIFPESIPQRIQTALSKIRLQQLPGELKEILEFSRNAKYIGQTKALNTAVIILPEQSLFELLSAYYPDLFATGPQPTIIPIPNPQLTGHTYRLVQEENGVRQLNYSSTPALMRGLLHAATTDLANIPNRTSSFSRQSLLIDLSRGGVYSIEFLKRIVVWSALNGLTHITLNTEFYELTDIPLTSPLQAVNRLVKKSGQLTQKEITELVQFARQFGITIYPTLQYLAHLEKMLELPELKMWRLLNSIGTLDPRHPKLYEELITPLIRNAIKPYVMPGDHLILNISFDETNELDDPELFIDHLHRVIGIVKDEARRYEISEHAIELYMWGDMLPKLSPKLRDEIPAIMRILYWEYDKTRRSEIADSISKDYIRKQIQLYGVTTSPLGHNQLLPQYERAVHNSTAMMDVALHHNLQEMMMAVWHDDNAECPFASMCGVIAHWSTSLWNGSSKEADALLKATTGLPLKWYRIVDALNHFDPKITPRKKVDITPNPLKIMFYEDPVHPVFSSINSQYYLEKLEQVQTTIEQLVEKESLEDLPVIEYTRKLVDFVVLKIAVTKEMHELSNNEASPADFLRVRLRVIETIQRLTEMWYAHSLMWLIEKKPEGLDELDRRYTFVWERLAHCLEQIDELNAATEVGAMNGKKIRTNFPVAYRHFETIAKPELLQ